MKFKTIVLVSSSYTVIKYLDKSNLRKGLFSSLFQVTVIVSRKPRKQELIVVSHLTSIFKSKEKYINSHMLELSSLSQLLYTVKA